MNRILAQIIFFLIFNLQTVWADCDYNLEAPSIVYRTSETNPTIQSTVSINRRNSQSSNCSTYFLAFTSSLLGNYNRYARNTMNGGKIYYNLYKFSNSTGILKGVSDISSPDETFSGIIGKNQTNTYSYYMSLSPLGNIAPHAGVYYDDVKIEAYTGTYTNKGPYENHRNLNIYIVVPKFTSLSLVDTGGSYDPGRTFKTLDFGELTTGKELSFDTRVVSNAGYRLKISSANNGKLSRNRSFDRHSSIHYRFYANGNLINLDDSSNSPVTIATGSGVTSADGAKIPIRVLIGKVDNSKSPGVYQDYITLTTITND